MLPSGPGARTASTRMALTLCRLPSLPHPPTAEAVIEPVAVPEPEAEGPLTPSPSPEPSEELSAAVDSPPPDPTPKPRRICKIIPKGKKRRKGRSNRALETQAPVE
ncbi:hypothetical protein chiPu_0027596 [Chiloscyllium punctatum]|uniref:Uncharacterized protein n=1 Tax=Chiloscyllium punctatum TaxID=137246 RepID=A0A401TLI9_CHIPU|nr:hypothetical protein [Chiloscyllium punctatum]